MSASVGIGLLDVMCCPGCAGTLVAVNDGYRCDACGHGYPMLGTIPCLVEDPTLWRTQWLGRRADYAEAIRLRTVGLRKEASSATLMPRTRQRLLRVAAALARQLDVVDELFEPLEVGEDRLMASVVPRGPEAGQGSAILQCYENLFRDWVWGQGEGEMALSFVAPRVPAGAGPIAFYGAGTGRLALDVHRGRGAGRTLAVDVNPLPFLVTGRLLGGDTVSLPEFPADPISDDVVVVSHTMDPPAPVRDGFSLLFADALRPPLRLASLDAVVTSWFIDIAPADLRATAAAINRALRPGGTWVNIGPLRFQSNLSRAYTFEEVLEIVDASAFEVVSQDRMEWPYFDSPVSGSRRRDTVLGFAARKTDDAPLVETRDALPSWVANPTAPIPITPELIALGRASVFTTGVLGMIDGHRSVIDVARELSRAWGVEPTRLQDELRNFFACLAG